MHIYHVTLIYIVIKICSYQHDTYILSTTSIINMTDF